MTPAAYAFLGLTALVAALVALLTYAVARFSVAARDSRRGSRESGMELALMSAALQEAVGKLKAQERATAARAQASERLSEEIIASLTAGLLVSGLNGDVRIMNPAGRRMLGLRDSDGPDDCGPALDEVSLSPVVQECLRTGTAIVRRVVALPGPVHGISHLGVTVSPLSDEGGKVQGAICLFTDLTSVKDMEEQLRLKDSLATVGELTAGIAHEFRNGLATIHGYSKLFDVRTLPDVYRTYIEGIRSESESLSQVVTNFLAFARPAELVLSQVDLAAICERAADEVRADATAHGGEVTVSGPFGEIEGDEVLLRQAFSNLLRNALDACVDAKVPPRIGVHSEIDRAQRVLRITVNDNGPGIPVASRERIFRPFFTSKRNGTGLGLALVQKIIVFHNGRVVAGTSPSGGASLQITLPTGG
jgi:signal transduction histidine kinase